MHLRRVRVLTICGSPVADGSTARFLAAFAKTYPEHTWAQAPELGTLPLFTPARLAAGRRGAPEVLAKAVAAAEGLIVATPEYAHNVPAALKNAFEWLVASGEFWRKPTLAITCTPHAPRGEDCMRSLVATLRAVDADVRLEVPLYDVGAQLSDGHIPAASALREQTDLALEILVGA